MDCST
jgi:CRP-like cAMP-binding protein